MKRQKEELRIKKQNVTGRAPPAIGLTQVEHFDESDTHGSVLGRGDGSVRTRRKRGENGCFAIFGRRQASFLDDRALLVFPIVIALQQEAIAIAQFEGW